MDAKITELEQEISAAQARLESLRTEVALRRRVAELRRQQQVLEQQLDEAGPSRDKAAVAEMRKAAECPNPHYPPFCTQPHYPTYPPYCARPHADEWNRPRWPGHPWTPAWPPTTWYGHGSASGNGDSGVLRGQTFCGGLTESGTVIDSGNARKFGGSIDYTTGRPAFPIPE